MQRYAIDTGGSFCWAADGDPLRRTSTAVALPGGPLLVDPVDVDGLDALLEPLGRPIGVTYLLDRHRRDADRLAQRLALPVLVPAVLAGEGDPLELPGVEERVVLAAPGWNESALWFRERRLLVCADALGTVGYFLARPDDPLGVHPLLRVRPPVRALSGLEPAVVAVGHGPPVVDGAAEALARALGRARRDLPRAWARAVSMALPNRSGGRRE